MVNEEANGKFLVVVLSMTNVGNESINVSTAPYQLIDQQGRLFDPSGSAGAYLEADDRWDVEAISYTQFQPGLETQGALVFDVAPGSGYGLVISPAGLFSNAEQHLVPLGTVQA